LHVEGPDGDFNAGELCAQWDRGGFAFGKRAHGEDEVGYAERGEDVGAGEADACGGLVKSRREGNGGGLRCVVGVGMGSCRLYGRWREYKVL
tara:strand:- start:6621 stop:6896 length:276 start_codon:yes stop_codon:yes gene_type:complete